MSTQPTALVADDDPSLRWVLSAYLSDRYRVLTAPDGIEAERLLMEPGLSLAVLDCDMPGQTGPEALRSARAAGCQVPALIVSGSVGPGISVEIPRAAFLAKPFTRNEFLAAVDSLLRE